MAPMLNAESHLQKRESKKNKATGGKISGKMVMGQLYVIPILR